MIARRAVGKEQGVRYSKGPSMIESHSETTNCLHWHRILNDGTSGSERTYQNNIGQFVRTEILWYSVGEMALFNIDEIE